MVAYVHLPDGHLRIMFFDSNRMKDIYRQLDNMPKNTVVNVYGAKVFLGGGVYTGKVWLAYTHKNGKMSKAKEKYQAYCLDNGLTK